MSLILPQTDLDGADAIAERIRTSVEGLRLARTDADSALHEAKRGGKNRTISAAVRATDAPGGGYA